MTFSEFILPEDLRAAKSALKKLGDQGFAVAGGTSLHFLSVADKTAVDLSRLGLSGIKKKGGTFLVGATTPLDDLMRYRSAGWVLDQVALHTSTQQVRNISTVGGNLARVFPWNDLPVALLALDATMVVEGAKEKAYAAGEFFDGQPLRLFKPGHLLTRVEVPALKKGQGFGYHKEVRLHAGFTLMTAAAVVTVKGGRIKEVRAAVGGGVAFPVRLPLLETALEGQPVDAPSLPQAIANGTTEVNWKGKEGLSDAYAAHLGRVVLADVLSAALRQAKGE
jgi:aerobic carbon-monoxide dehydrogenase medium subunit